MSHDAIHQEVSERYTAAVESGAGCCSKGAITPDYRGPEQQGVQSFGCGNPVAHAGLREGDTVLDLGSGAGLDLLMAAEKVGPTGTVIGVDMTDAMLEVARTNLEAAGATNVELRKGKIEALPVADGEVDRVLSNCVLNLSPDKPAVFAELARVLKPGGSFTVSDIVAEGLPDIVRNHAGAWCACVGGAITEAEYVAGLRAAGLEDVVVEARLDYDPDTALALAKEEKLVEGIPDELIAAALRGGVRVASIRVSGRKPA